MADRCGRVSAYARLKTWIQVYGPIHAEAIGRHCADLANDAAQETERLHQQEEPCREREVIYD